MKTTHLKRIHDKVKDQGGNIYISLKCAVLDQQELREVYGMKTSLHPKDVYGKPYDTVYVLKEDMR